MTGFKLEFSKTAYIVDFAVYLAVPAVVLWALLRFGPRSAWPDMAAVAVAGLAGWTLLEYFLHRFVLHGVQPFKYWHEQHHLRPYALIGTPTVFSLLLFAIFVFVPAWLFGSVWTGAALSLGVIAGYAVYSWVHHAVHHWRAHAGWPKRRKQLHAIHHHAQDGCNYGVITAFWDRVFGTYVDLS
jgi:sterol desaturase/sphingolipid hydroxylase (fatty acid hydroxylase superfamily)